MRLVRTLCPRCKDGYGPSSDELRFLGLSARDAQEIVLYRPVGCDHCFETGFRGRTGVFEILDMSDPIRRLIASGSPESMIRQTAIESGMVPIGQDGMSKVLAGETNIEEVQRVLVYEEEVARLCTHCHATVSSDFHFCPHCGHASAHACTRCQRRVDAGWAFCPSCGERRQGHTPRQDETLVGSPDPIGARREA
jgi:RNA polymerase subunit RPABC4/transcription elongation factor Spt4